MTKDQIREAVEQMKVQCDLKMANYEMVSARSALHELGYQGEDTEEVLKALFESGFTYCLDPWYHRGSEVVSADVCYWGPDQLKSRLDCIHIAA
jgi:hypothetical protein